MEIHRPEFLLRAVTWWEIRKLATRHKNAKQKRNIF